jgi:hypothetical protein
MRRELCRVLRSDLECLGISIASVFGGPLLPTVDTPRMGNDLDARHAMILSDSPVTYRSAPDTYA